MYSVTFGPALLSLPAALPNTKLTLMEHMGMDPQLLPDLVNMKMPFGKYKGTYISDLPVSYLEWFQREGFPPGRLGMMLATAYEIKLNGLDQLLAPLKKQRKQPVQPGHTFKKYTR